MSVTAEKGKHTFENSLGSVVERFLVTYFKEHKNHLPDGNVHELVMGEVERPLIEGILKLTEGNQKKASEILGINRNTLRKKIQIYGIK
jgi:DNA-binding protein Fis